MATKSWLTPRGERSSSNAVFLPAACINDTLSMVESFNRIGHAKTSVERWQRWIEQWAYFAIRKLEQGRFVFTCKRACTKFVRKWSVKKSWNATRHFPPVVLGHRLEFWLFELTEIYIRKNDRIAQIHMNILASITWRSIFLSFFFFSLFLFWEERREFYFPRFLSVQKRHVNKPATNFASPFA